MGFRDKVRKGLNLTPIAPGYAGGIGFAGRLHRGGGFNWHREAGVRYDNSIVYAAIQFAIDALLEVSIIHERQKTDGSWEEIKNSPIIDLINNPNPWYGYSTLLSGWVISELAGIPGQSHTFAHRSAGRKVVGLEYIPHFSIRPYWTPGSGNFIEYWRLVTQGGMQRIETEDLLVQRYGPINPLRPQISVGPLEASLLEVVTDKEAANYTAALLLNGGVTNALISPTMKDADGQEVLFGPEQMDKIEATFDEKITGDNRNRPLVAGFPLKVDEIGLDPARMNLEGIRNINEERVCATLRIPPQVLHLGTGLENQNNRASANAAMQSAARSFVKPYMIRKAMELTRFLIPELGLPGERIRWKWEDIEALQEDKTESAKRDRIEVGGPWVTVNEKRLQRGMEEIEGGDVLRQPNSKADNEKDEDDEDKTDEKQS